MDFNIPQETEPQAPVVIPIASGLDLAPIRQDLAQYDIPLARMEEESKTLVVDNPDTNSRAVALGGGAKTLHKNLKRALDTLIAPANDHIKAVRNLFRGYLDRLEAVEAGMKQKVAEFQHQQRLEQQRLEAIQREEARKLQAKIDAEAKAQREEAERKAKEAAEKLKKEKDADTRAALQKTIEDETAAALAPTPQVATVVTPTSPNVVRTETGSAHLRMKWSYEILDETKVPNEYKIVDSRLVQKAVDAGIREIPGIRVFEKPILNIRT